MGLAALETTGGREAAGGGAGGGAGGVSSRLSSQEGAFDAATEGVGLVVV